MVGVFARHSPLMGSKNSGYSVILVKCENEEQLNAVRHALAINEFRGLVMSKGAWKYEQGYLGYGHGGQFDFIYAAKDYLGEPATRYNVIDDERYVGIFDGAEILEELTNAIG